MPCVDSPFNTDADECHNGRVEGGDEHVSVEATEDESEQPAAVDDELDDLGHAEQHDDEVGHRQVDDEQVGGRATHRAVSQHGEQYQRVAADTDNTDDAEEDR